MSAIGRVRSWVRAVILRDRAEREMREEMCAHIALAVERFKARGMPDADAEAAARREFGHVSGIEEHARDARGGAALDGLAGDVKFALRYFARTPLATVTIVLTLTVGIGVSSAIFSVVRTVLTRPAPLVPNDPALVKIRAMTAPPLNDRQLSYVEVEAYRALSGEFAAVGAWTSTEVVLDDGRTERNVALARAHVVTPNYFAILGIVPAAGRLFSSSSGDAAPEFVAVASHHLATIQLGGPRAAVGKNLQINGISYTVIGVAPNRFASVIPAANSPDVWIPLSTLQTLWGVPRNPLTDPNATNFNAFARLSPGITIEDASRAVRHVATNIDRSNAVRRDSNSIAIADLVRLRGLMENPRARREAFTIIGLITSIAVLVLLMCTTTVGSLLVGGGVARRYEIGVRLALGAARTRIIRQLLSETAILALVGGGLGLALFAALCRVIENQRVGFDLTPDWRTLTFTLSCALLATVLSGLFPALHATRAGVSDVLKDGMKGATTRSRLQRTFVVAQIAVSTPLLAALAALIVEVASGLPPELNEHARQRVLRIRFATDVRRADSARDVIPGLIRQIQQLPAVTAAVRTSNGNRWLPIERQGRLSAQDSIRVRRTSTLIVEDVPRGYFGVMGIPIVQGRDFIASDSAASVTPVILEEETAREWFGPLNPIGQRVFHRQLRDLVVDANPIELEVIGVVRFPREGRYGVGYLARTTDDGNTVLVQTSAPAEQIIPAVLSIARTDARGMPITQIRSLASADRERRARALQTLGGGAGAGSIALLLAAIGLYAIVAISVGQRLREIGVRMALGAHPHRVVAGFLADGLRTAGIGIAFGVPLGLVGLESLVSVDAIRGNQTLPLILVVAGVIAIVAALATWIPARRAAGVDPMSALRVE